MINATEPAFVHFYKKLEPKDFMMESEYFKMSA